MTHDEILNAARERIAEIDKQKAALDAERAKLQALLDASDGKTGAAIIEDALKRLTSPGTTWPQPFFIPPPVYPYQPPPPPWGAIISTTSLRIPNAGPTLTDDARLSAEMVSIGGPPGGLDLGLVIGGPQRPPGAFRFTS